MGHATECSALQTATKSLRRSSGLNGVDLLFSRVSCVLGTASVRDCVNLLHCIPRLHAVRCIRLQPQSICVFPVTSITRVQLLYIAAGNTTRRTK